MARSPFDLSVSIYRLTIVTLLNRAFYFKSSSSLISKVGLDSRAAADMMGPDRQKNTKSSRASSRTRAPDVHGGIGAGGEREPAANEEIAMQTLRDPDDSPRTKGRAPASRRSAHTGHVAIAMPAEGAADASPPSANADPVAVAVDGDEDGGALTSHIHTHTHGSHTSSSVRAATASGSAQ